MKRYVVHPGKIASKNDGQIHYVGFAQLCRLYKVDPSICINAETMRPREWPEDADHLYPDYHGNYQLP